jgi:hypothetical protein
MTRFIVLLFIISFSFFTKAQNENITLLPDEKYPLWLKTDQASTNQTSGIAFIKSEYDKKYFLLADDIGFINLLTIKSDSIFSIENILFVDSAELYFSNFPKKDFEEITYDKNSGDVYLSVEGNGENFNDYVGIYKLIFKNNDVLSRQVISIEKMIYAPADVFYKHTSWNIGYEGFALDDNCFYLGLEGFLNNYQFADSALIIIADKSDLNIIKKISTKSFGVHTICGLFSDENYSLWGIDRNNRTIFHFLFDENFDIEKFSKYDCSTTIPGYHDLNYLPSFEGITLDDDGDVYIIDDPWKEVFVPQQHILDQLDSETINNFKQYIPTIFKYKITHR